jgi:hypothetical protein
VSPLFRGRRRFVERSCDQWFVLSALHGVIEPAQVVAPYDKTLKDAGRDERRRWSAAVLGDLKRRLHPVGVHIFEIHAGADYFAWGLVDGLKAAGATVLIPTQGLGVGKQLAFYAQQ